MAWTRLSDFKVPKSRKAENEIQMSHATDSTSECLVEYHASNELGCLNLRELNFKIINFKAKNNSSNLRLKANEMNAL